MLGLSRKERIAARAAEAAKAREQAVRVAVALGAVERELGALRRAEAAFAHAAGNSATSEKTLLSAWRELKAAREQVAVARTAHQQVAAL